MRLYSWHKLQKGVNSNEKKFFSFLLAIALVLVILPVSGVHAQLPAAYESGIQIQNLAAEEGDITLTFFNLQGFVVGIATEKKSIQTVH